MKRILQLVATRWLARTPFGLVVLGIGWLVMRKRRGHQAGDRNDVSREHGRKSGNPYMWQGPSARTRK
ncbi:DUF6203 family protein [Sphaerisporangium sp. NBC_01403]|uniref:DUF6203 family protein n=1 Tax=Sphaerisporangium sp. NBC_01403 TaxID=2903599 RepID=UPI00324ABF94